MLLPISIIIAMTGWVQYRYRQTRAMTMAQFMEIRYSRHFRLFAGFLCFFSGLLNFGIFPAVGGRFFQYFCGLPPYMVSLGFMQIDLVYAGIMAILLVISLGITFLGGQIAVMVTDFVQGVFCNIALCLIGGYLLFFHFDWSQMMEAFLQAPKDASLINPAHSGDTDDYNATYFLIAVCAFVLNWMAWQGNQGYYAAARTPHAARMGRLIGSFREIIQTVPIVLLAVGAYTILHHADFASQAAQMKATLGAIDNPTIQSQQTVSIAIIHMLPVGLIGVFAAIMFGAFVSTHDTYLHSWGSIFIQDVILPTRQILFKTSAPLSPRAHMRILRLSMLGVALFIFCFSLFFSQQQDVLMFFALTGTFYVGWAGWTIVGGLYWKHGNTAGAWAAALAGLFISMGNWALIYQWPMVQSLLGSLLSQEWQAAETCPVNAQILYFWSMASTGVVYGGISLLTGRGAFNMDKMLHRGAYAIENDAEHVAPARGLAALKMGPQFALDDKILYLSSLAYVLFFFGIFLVGTLLFVLFAWDPSDVFWGNFWWGYSVLMLAASLTLSIWFAVGGFGDFRRLYQSLGTAKRDAADDGTVSGDKK